MRQRTWVAEVADHADGSRPLSRARSSAAATCLRAASSSRTAGNPSSTKSVTGSACPPLPLADGVRQRQREGEEAGCQRVSARQARGRAGRPGPPVTWTMGPELAAAGAAGFGLIVFETEASLVQSGRRVACWRVATTRSRRAASTNRQPHLAKVVDARSRDQVGQFADLRVAGLVQLRQRFGFRSTIRASVALSSVARRVTSTRRAVNEECSPACCAPRAPLPTTTGFGIGQPSMTAGSARPASATAKASSRRRRIDRASRARSVSGNQRCLQRAPDRRSWRRCGCLGGRCHASARPARAAASPRALGRFQRDTGPSGERRGDRLRLRATERSGRRGVTSAAARAPPGRLRWCPYATRTAQTELAALDQDAVIGTSILTLRAGQLPSSFASGGAWVKPRQASRSQADTASARGVLAHGQRAPPPGSQPVSRRKRGPAAGDSSRRGRTSPGVVDRRQENDAGPSAARRRLTRRAPRPGRREVGDATIGPSSLQRRDALARAAQFHRRGRRPQIAASRGVRGSESLVRRAAGRELDGPLHRAVARLER